MNNKMNIFYEKKALFKMKSEKCLIKSDFKNEYLIINSQY